MNTARIRGMIVEKFKTIGAFADAIKWGRGKASRIINGTQDPDISDVQDMAKILGIKDKEDFVDIFFADLSTMCTTDEEKVG